MRNRRLFSYAQDNYTKFFYIINKKNYLFRVTFLNADGISVDFQKGAIKELYLHDLLTNPFKRGYIVIDNTNDVIERFKSSPSDKEFFDSEIQRGYRVRGDGRDLILITIIPVEPSNNPYNDQSVDYNRIFGFQYAFILGNELDTSSATGKLKKYELIDADEEYLKDRKIFFSTVDVLRRPDAAFLSDRQREALTGDSLKYILVKGLEDNTAIFSTLSGNVVDTPNFESGASKIFYSSPNDYSALDDLNYVYNFHVSNESAKDFSFLQKDDFIGEYTLQSCSSIFNKAFDKQSDAGGLYFVENLTITGAQDAPNVIENDIKKPLRALEFGETGDIIDVKFFNTPGSVYQDRIQSVLVHAYDFENKTFSINQVDGDIEKTKKEFTQSYVQPMKGKDNRPSPNFIINNTQKTNQNFKNEFLIYSEDNDFLKLSVGRNRLLKDALMLNLGVEITVQGGFQRKSGKFISIDRTGNYIDNDFDNKFLGLYFIISVEHTFINDDQYVNKIIAVKTYHFNDPKINENIP
jgi:hypothetical protein